MHSTSAFTQPVLCIPAQTRAPLRYAVPLLLYLSVTFFTTAAFMGDTIDYVDSTVKSLTSQPADDFWDFGHLLWRATGRAVVESFAPLLHRVAGPRLRDQTILAFLVLSWASGLLSVLALATLTHRFGATIGATVLAAGTLLVSNAFLNYAQTGNAYVAGLAALLVGMVLLSGAASWRGAVAGGVALAAAVCLWFCYVLALPAALLVPFARHGLTRRALHTSIVATFAAAAVGLSAYAIVARHLRIDSVADAKAWVMASSHGVSQVRGVTRAVFGFPRSAIHMGEDGVLFKRFLLRDPYNPVSLPQLFGLSLWKLLLFYACLGTLGVALLRRRGASRRVLALLAINAIPVLAFAVMWQGGDPERYLPLFPTLLLALAVALSDVRSVAGGAIALTLVVTIAAVNVAAMWTPRIDSNYSATARRIATLPRDGQRLLIISHPQDELLWYRRRAALGSSPHDDGLDVHPLLMPGTDRVPHWRGQFAAAVLSTWRRGGSAWVSSRLLSDHPDARWRWVEGTDPRVSWRDLHEFVSRMQIGAVNNNTDGFALLPDCPHNRQLLNEHVDR